MQKLPAWIQEILKNDENKEVFHLVDAGHFAVIPDHSDQVLFDKYPHVNKKNFRVVFFRDGPFLPISTGGASSIFGMMNALASHGIGVYLLYCYRGWSDYNFYKKQKFSTIFINKKDFYSNSSLISKILIDLDINICHFDSAEAISIQRNLLPKNCKTVFEVHNVENELMKQIGCTREEVENMKIKEMNAIKMSDSVIVRSKENYKSLINLECNKSKLFMYRGGIDADSIVFKKRSNLDKRVIVFLGHLNYEPNRQAVDIIANKITPNVTDQVKFFISGKGSPELSKKYSSDSILFLGQIPDLNNLFSKVDIALAPIITGSGTRLKVLDYMAAGIPVIGTDIAIEGLEQAIRQCMIVENDFSKYPQIISNLYRSPDKVSKLSVNGRKFVEKYRNWNTCINDVISAYISILD